MNSSYNAARRRRIGMALAHGVGLVFLIIAATALAYEVMAFSQTGSYRMVPTGEIWFTVHVGSMNLIQAVTQRYIHPALWDPIIAGMLQWPAWSLLGAPGVVLAYGLPRGRG